jgi:hypothetical protein
LVALVFRNLAIKRSPMIASEISVRSCQYNEAFWGTR